jgi:hypothetical protein
MMKRRRGAEGKNLDELGVAIGFCQWMAWHPARTEAVMQVTGFRWSLNLFIGEEI